MPLVELEIKKDLTGGLKEVFQQPPRADDPRVVLAVFLKKFADGYGLAEPDGVDHDPFEWVDQDPVLGDVLGQMLGTGGPAAADDVRDQIYRALRDLASDSAALKTLDGRIPLTPRELMLTGQVFWNLEARGTRADLPLKPAPDRTGSRLDIPVPGTSRDFATMRATRRANEKCAGKPAGASFRKRSARLVALVAQTMLLHPDRRVDATLMPQGVHDESSGDLRALSWDDGSSAGLLTSAAVVNDAAPPAAGGGVDVLGPVVVGNPAPVGKNYQERWIDFEIGHLWADGDDRRVWISGAPGAGKSFTARRIMQNALADQGKGRPLLFVWVESANTESTSSALVAAAEGLRARGLMAPTSRSRSDAEVAQDLLATLAASPWPWLVILDNAEVDELIRGNLVPTGSNPLGRVLVTTTSGSRLMRANGTVLDAPLFSDVEARDFLRKVLGSQRSDDDLARLSKALGHQPLALAIAAATIDVHAMSVSEWLEEFEQAPAMDDAGDEPDGGGYPHLIAATWQTALRRAGGDLPAEVVERAALVAALQHPDGHPTWVWESEELGRWIGGGEPLRRRGRKPEVLQLLVSHQLVAHLGESWEDGHIAMHQLAARAVREVATPTTLAECAELVAVEWLRRHAVGRPTSRVTNMNMHVLHSLAPHLSDFARTIVGQLGAASQPPSLQEAVWSINATREMAAQLLAGGASGALVWAREWGKRADDLEATNTPVETLSQHALPLPAQMRAQALEKVDEVLADSTLQDGLRAHAFALAASLCTALGRLGEAHRHCAEALPLYDKAVAESDDVACHRERLELMAAMKMSLSVGDRSLERILPRLPLEGESKEHRLDGFRDRHEVGEVAHLLERVGRRERAADLYASLLASAKRSAELLPDDVKHLERACRQAIEDGRWGEALDFAETAFDRALVRRAEAALMLASVHVMVGNRVLAEEALGAVRDSAWPTERGADDPLDLDGCYAQLAVPLPEEGASAQTVDLYRHVNEMARQTHRNMQDLRVSDALVLAARAARYAEAAHLLELQVARVERTSTEDVNDDPLRIARLRLRAGVCWSLAEEPAKALPVLVDGLGALQALPDTTSTSEEVESLRCDGTLALAGVMADLERHEEALEVLGKLGVIVGPEGFLRSVMTQGRQEECRFLAVYLRSSAAAGRVSDAASAGRRLIELLREELHSAGVPSAWSYAGHRGPFGQMIGLLLSEERLDEALDLSSEVVALARQEFVAEGTLVRQQIVFFSTVRMAQCLTKADCLLELGVTVEDLLEQAIALVESGLAAGESLSNVEDMPLFVRALADQVDAERVGLRDRVLDVADQLEKRIAGGP